MVSRLDPGLPDCLPILGAALLSQGPDPGLPPRPDGAAPEALPLSALLSRALLSFAVEYERDAGLSRGRRQRAARRRARPAARPPPAAHSVACSNRGRPAAARSEGSSRTRDNWRASVRPSVTLPHFPMVLHRGGYPDDAADPLSHSVN